MPLRSIWSRDSIVSTSEVATVRQRPPASSSKVIVSRLTRSGLLSKAKVWTDRSGARTSWKLPQNPIEKSSAARVEV